MKKIFNWSFGAFFRTIGRILAYLLVGALITLICLKNDKLKSLLFMNVNASTSNSFWLRDTETIVSGGIYDCSSESSCKEVYSQSSTFAINDQEVRGTISNTNKLKVGPNGNVLNIGGYLLKKNYFYNIEIYVCSSDNLSNLSAQIYGSSYNYWGNDNLYNNTSRSSLHGLAGQENTFNYCYLYSGLVAPNGDQTQINLRLRGSANVSTYYYMMGAKVESLGIYSGAIEDIVENSGFATASSVEEVKQATNEVKSEIKSTNDTLNNDDTTESEGKISGFFNDFTDDSHGLSSIVTAPLNAVNAMLSTTCTAPTATYKGSTFSLPCGSLLWERDGADNFKLLLNLFYGGLICYGILKSLFKDVNDLKNPDNDKIEVVDL